MYGERGEVDEVAVGVSVFLDAVWLECGDVVVVGESGWLGVHASGSRNKMTMAMTIIRVENSDIDLLGLFEY